MKNDVAGLLAAQHRAAPQHFFEHVLIAHRRPDHADSVRASARSRPRFDITVATTHGRMAVNRELARAHSNIGP